MKSHQKYSHLQENEDADVYLLTRKSIQDRVQRWGARQEVLCEAFYETEYAHDLAYLYDWLCTSYAISNDYNIGLL